MDTRSWRTWRGIPPAGLSLISKKYNFSSCCGSLIYWQNLVLGIFHQDCHIDQKSRWKTRPEHRAISGILLAFERVCITSSGRYINSSQPSWWQQNFQAPKRHLDRRAKLKEGSGHHNHGIDRNDKSGVQPCLQGRYMATRQRLDDGERQGHVHLSPLHYLRAGFFKVKAFWNGKHPPQKSWKTSMAIDRSKR